MSECMLRIVFKLPASKRPEAERYKELHELIFSSKIEIVGRRLTNEIICRLTMYDFWLFGGSEEMSGSIHRLLGAENILHSLWSDDHVMYPSKCNADEKWDGAESEPLKDYFSRKYPDFDPHLFHAGSQIFHGDNVKKPLQLAIPESFFSQPA